MYQGMSVAVVIPARDEAAALGGVLADLWRLRNEDGNPVIDDIVVCDSASRDSTAAVAAAGGARVVSACEPGYGRACQVALDALHDPDLVLFVDGDRSVDSADIPPLLAALTQGAGLVIGARLGALRQSGALTPQQIIGNWLACWLIRRLWRVPVKDLGPLRVIRTRTLRHLGMRDTAYGWTVEMQLRAIQAGLCLVEVPVHSLRRIGRSKISGTLRGTLGAAHGIFGTILRLWWRPPIYRDSLSDQS